MRARAEIRGGRLVTTCIVASLPDLERVQVARLFAGMRVQVIASQLRSADGAETYVGELADVLLVVGVGYVVLLRDASSRDAAGRVLAGGEGTSVGLKLATVRSIRELVA